MKIKKVTEFEGDPGSGLNFIVQKAHLLEEIEKKIQKHLPDDSLKEHCRLANINNGIIIFAVQSSAWGMRLRYILPDILKSLQREKEFQYIRQLSFYVEPDFEKIFKNN